MVRGSYMRFWIVTLTLCLSLHAATGHALTSDNDQPATIEADEVEFDFRTGKRTYKGNVIVTQGTLKITGDRMEVQYENDVIQAATSWGNPATFKQRPDGKQEDVYGEGDTIILNDVEQTLTLIDNAVMIQAGNTAKGKEIVYRMEEDKMTVKGLRETKPASDDDSGATKTESGRARVIIRPEATSGGTSGAGEEEKEGVEKEEGTEEQTSETHTESESQGMEKEGNEEESGDKPSE